MSQRTSGYSSSSYYSGSRRSERSRSLQQPMSPRTAPVHSRSRSFDTNRGGTSGQAMKKKYPRPEECECGPDIYGALLGPTVDEQILAGLQALFSMAEVCPEEPPASVHSIKPPPEPDPEVSSYRSEPSEQVSSPYPSVRSESFNEPERSESVVTGYPEEQSAETEEKEDSYVSAVTKEESASTEVTQSTGTAQTEAESQNSGFQTEESEVETHLPTTSSSEAKSQTSSEQSCQCHPIKAECECVKPAGCLPPHAACLSPSFYDPSLDAYVSFVSPPGPIQPPTTTPCGPCVSSNPCKLDGEAFVPTPHHPSSVHESSHHHSPSIHESSHHHAPSQYAPSVHEPSHHHSPSIHKSSHHAPSTHEPSYYAPSIHESSHHHHHHHSPSVHEPSHHHATSIHEPSHHHATSIHEPSHHHATSIHEPSHHHATSVHEPSHHHAPSQHAPSVHESSHHHPSSTHHAPSTHESSHHHHHHHESSHQETSTHAHSSDGPVSLHDHHQHKKTETAQKEKKDHSKSSCSCSSGSSSSLITRTKSRPCSCCGSQTSSSDTKDSSTSYTCISSKTGKTLRIQVANCETLTATKRDSSSTSCPCLQQLRNKKMSSCVCDKKRPSCNCCQTKKNKKKNIMICECNESRSSSNEPDEVSGIEEDMGDAKKCEVRYAITKITKFQSYTTFEVMKSTRKRPKVLPGKLEGVFVLRNKNRK